MEVELPAVVFREGRFYVAFCPVNSVASQGKTVEEALKNLREALELYYEDEDAKLPRRIERCDEVGVRVLLQRQP